MPLEKESTPPSVWTEHKTPEGRRFWHNIKTNSSTWDKPEELQTEAERRLSQQTQWKEYSTPDGRTYWFHAETKQSVWNVPDEVRRLKEQTIEKWPVFTDKKEAREKLRSLFESCNVTVKTKWDEAVKLITADSRFSCFAILPTGEKKQVFTEYNGQLQRKAKEAQRANRAKAREEAVEAVTVWPRLTAAALYQNFAEDHYQSWWWTHIDERERDEIFQDFMDDYERKEHEDRRRRRKIVVGKIEAFVELTDDIDFESPWNQVVDRLKECDFVRGVENLDLLLCWEDFVKRADEKDRAKRKRSVYRTMRERRDQLVALYHELIKNGQIDLDSSWRDVAIFLDRARDNRYLDVLGQGGSTPQDLFEELRDERILAYERTKSQLKKMVRTADLQISPDSTYEWLSNELSELPEFLTLQQVSDSDVRRAFEHLLRKAISHASKSGEHSDDGRSPSDGGGRDSRSRKRKALRMRSSSGGGKRSPEHKSTKRISVGEGAS